MPPFITITSANAVDLSFSAAQLFSVRSSFSAEDGKDHSFAGQFKTLLNVKKQDVKKAVQEVLDSANSAIEYERAHGIKIDGEMRVIVQEMISADCSGVIFTANPKGLISETVITIGAGCGSGVVGGTSATTTYHYNRADKKYYFETQENSAQIKRSAVEALVEQGDKIEQLFGAFCDIEFCIKDEKIYILQARPITALPEGEDIVLDSSNISESYPGTCLPATQSFAAAVYKRVFQSCVLLLSNSNDICSSLEDVLSNMVQTANGRIYYRIDNWYRLIKILPFSKKIIPIWQEMLGVNKKTVPGGCVKVGFFTKFRIAVNSVLLLFNTPKKMRELDVYFNSIFDETLKKVDATTNTLELINMQNELVFNIGGKWGITLVNDLYAFIFTSLAKKRHKQQLDNVKMIESLEPVYALDELALIAGQSGIQSDEYKEKKAEYLYKYGDRCLEELKLETITLNTDPQMLDKFVRSHAYTGKKRREDDKKRKDPFFVRHAKLGIFNRELSRMHRTRLYGIMRKIVHKIGKNLAADGLIEHERDVFWLYFGEFKTCAQQKTDMRETVMQRKARHLKFDKLPSYSRLVYRGVVIDKTPVNINGGTYESHGNELIGVPCSGGVITGEVLVVEKPSLGLDTTGKILVTDTTDPGWVFLMQNALGVIAQRGSLLSHTAIITRELKKPSVVAVAGAMQALKTGDVVRLDGDIGTVTIMQ